MFRLQFRKSFQQDNKNGYGTQAEVERNASLLKDAQAKRYLDPAGKLQYCLGYIGNKYFNHFLIFSTK